MWMMRKRRAMTPDRAARPPASAGHVSSCERDHAAHAASPHAVSAPIGSDMRLPTCIPTGMFLPMVGAKGLTLTLFTLTQDAKSCFALSSLWLKCVADCWTCNLNPRHGSELCGPTLALLSISGQHSLASRSPLSLAEGRAMLDQDLCMVGAVKPDQDHVLVRWALSVVRCGRLAQATPCHLRKFSRRAARAMHCWQQQTQNSTCIECVFASPPAYNSNPLCAWGGNMML